MLSCGMEAVDGLEEPGEDDFLFGGVCGGVPIIEVGKPAKECREEACGDAAGRESGMNERVSDFTNPPEDDSC